MVTVYSNAIYMTRGDTLRLQVGIMVDGEAYTPQEGDVVRFAMKHSALNRELTEYADSTPLVQKTIDNDTLVLELVPADTQRLGFGDYDYDVQITFADGTVSTFISDKLTLTKEVY